ncbi:MAG: RsmD family RNA methyltransferase, partial [Amphiplicatus sp.]
MRIVGGQLRGRSIVAPKGSDTRPTSDRTRESLFNILAHREDFSFEGARVIDLFAGSGALGFEAMSRGAEWCLFVDADAAARGAIRDNIEALGLFGRGAAVEAGRAEKTQRLDIVADRAARRRVG